MRRSIVIAPAMALALAVPALAQQTDAQTRSQVEAVVMKWVDSLNKGDVQARAALQTADAFDITPFGKYTGPQIAELMERVH